jgi:hypothetical protein
LTAHPKQRRGAAEVALHRDGNVMFDRQFQS